MRPNRPGAGRPLSLRVRSALVAAATALAILAGASGTEDAEANGDTRTINLYHEHTKESAQITFKRNGSYDGEALKQLNWMLRDWRLDEPTRMEPRLFDIVWEVYREVGASEPIHVVSAYRSPETNAMLRRRSKAVAEHSQHMLGHAMDFYLPDVPMSRVREVGMRLQEGGVGFYPNAYNPFVHLDAGSVRSWPRMSSDQLARLFPDGRTVHMPRDGHPLPGYELAKAEILARGGTVAGTSYAEAGEEGGPRKSLWAMLFGGGGDDEDADFYRSQSAGGGRTASRAAAARFAAANAPAAPSAAGGGNQENAGVREFMLPSLAAAAVPAPARTRSGRTILAAASPPPVVPQAVADVPAAAPPLFARPADAPAPPIDVVPSPEVARAIRVLETAPVPPRRPGELEGLLATNAPLPPSRPFAVAAVAGSAPALPARLAGEMAAAGPGAEERAALRALFDAAATPVAGSHRAGVTTSRTRSEPTLATALFADAGRRVRMEFTSAGSEPGAGNAFSGPAVAPLPIMP